MMAGLLTQEEANELIEMLKKTVEQQIAFPSEKGGISFMEPPEVFSQQTL